MRSAHVRRAACAPGVPRPRRKTATLVAARLLRVVHRDVRLDHELLGCHLRRRLREHRDADARRDAVPPSTLAVLRGWPTRIFSATSIASRLVGVRQDDGELVAAEPREDVGLAQPRPQRGGRPPDQLVARRVAERVVDVLEVVEVEREQRAPVP